jgi:hypothetical protein
MPGVNREEMKAPEEKARKIRRRKKADKKLRSATAEPLKTK